MKKSNVAIVVPFYTNRLSDQEEMSINQCFNILGEYDIFLMCPEGLHSKWEEKVTGIKYYSNIHFQNKYSYSRFMLNKEVYEDFVSYDYILIYQLDAFVLKNDLEQFCSYNYDYIGASWPYGITVHTPIESKVIYVGNGGFSLRKVDAFIAWTEKNKGIIDGLFPFCAKAEDILIGYLGDLKIAPYEVATKFSIETAPHKCIEQNGGLLPFGCHNLQSYDLDLYRKIVSNDFFTPQEFGIGYKKVDSIQIIEEEVFKEGYNDEMFREYFEKNIEHFDGEVCVWGTGFYGAKAYALCTRAGIKVHRFIDNNFEQQEFLGRPVINGMMIGNHLERDMFFIVGVKEAEDIVNQLQDLGFISHRDFVTIYDIFLGLKELKDNLFRH